MKKTFGWILVIIGVMSLLGNIISWGQAKPAPQIVAMIIAILCIWFGYKKINKIEEE